MSNRGLTKARKEFMDAARYLDMAQGSYDFILHQLKVRRKILNKARAGFQAAGEILADKENDCA